MTRRLIATRRGGLAALGTALVLSLAAPASAAPAGSAGLSALPDGNVTIDIVAVAGSGCTPGTAKVSTHPDRSGFRIRYDDFVAAAGGGVDVPESRKNCQLAVLIDVPPGWTAAIATADYRGRARIPAGATGQQQTNYYWQGSSENSRTGTTFAGPYNGFWATRDVAPALFYLPCGQQRVLNINTELRVDAGTASGPASMSMTTTEGDVDTLFNLNWTRC
nr:DUF4360 domain-containing protein [Micromonospora sp. DSM 115978]